MAVRDSRLLVKDDYSNIKILGVEGIIDGGLKSSLEKANGLRNRLVQEYKFHPEPHARV